jgi:pyridoxamine 5'-phosphate oxidase
LDTEGKVKLDTPMASESKKPDQELVTKDSIRAMRRSYGEAGLSEQSAGMDPINLFHHWLHEASENLMIVEANAMVLSTSIDNQPVSRTVLLKDVHHSGFTFFTNYLSRKAKAISDNPNVSLLFPWYAMERQVIVTGKAKKVSEEESVEYFATRPWGSQIGAWASSQSDELESREVLEARYQEYAKKYPQDQLVPKPDHWGGYLVEPTSIEFWQGRYSRLHDRLRFEGSAKDWRRTRLNP